MYYNLRDRIICNNVYYCHISSVVVRSTTAYIDGHRVTDKQHSCVLCGKLYHRIARHLQTVHKDDTAVTAVTSRTKNEKRKGLDKLRLEGDYRHNINVLTNNDGNLIVARRPSTNSAETYSYSEYLPCEYCKGFYLRNDLWRHRAKCEFAPTMATTEDQSRPKERVQRNSVLLLQSSLPDNKDLHKGFMSNVISTLSCDGTTLIVRNDNLILKVGENLYMKHGRDQKQYISQEVRLLGRLVQSLRKIGVNKNGYLTDYLKPSMFDTIVEAAQELAGVQESDDKFSFNTPSVALKLGPVLKKCCVVLKGHALRNSDEIGERDAERLQKLIEEEWKTKVTSVALRSIKEKKRNTQILLPTASDLMKFKIYVDAQLTEAQQRLIKEETMDTYQRLSTVVICKIITFNRRRSGEVSKMLLDDFVNRPDWQSNLNEEIVQSLAELEKKLVQR